MHPRKQFWALLKFQTRINPAIWFMPIAFGLPLFIPFWTDVTFKNYHPSFFSLFSNQNLMFVCIFGTMILAPEKFQMGSTASTSGYFGTEFLLTRAIDRPLLYRVRAAFLYTLFLLLPVVAILHATTKPDLIVTEYSKTVQQQCLATVPGSSLSAPEWNRSSRSLISLPHGNVLVAEWQTWVLVVAVIVLQVLVLALYPLKHAKWVIWGIYFGLIFVPLFDLTHLRRDEPTVNEQIFFSFAGHQALTWILTAMVFVLVQLWCEWRFARLEQ